MADELIALFGKITTSDHDQLVEQFSRILQVESHVATFFLEASNWNVEIAVHNYLAANQRHDNGMIPLSSPPLATLLGDLSIWQSVAFQPNIRLPIKIHIQNSGTLPWPDDAFLTFVDGDRMAGPQGIAVRANPGDIIEIILVLTSPEAETTAMGTWRLACSQGYFGEPIFLIITSSNSAAPVNFDYPPSSQNNVNTEDLNMNSMNITNNFGPNPNQFAPPQQANPGNTNSRSGNDENMSD